MRQTEFINTPSLKDAIKRAKHSLILYSPTNLKLEVSENALLILAKKKYHIITHGCQANVRDEETFSGILLSLGMEQVDSPNEANIIIINTCSVRENANNKVYAEIGNFKHLKEKAKKDNKLFILCVAGCMVEVKDTLDKMLNTYPQVDLYLGTHNINDLPSLLDKLLSNNLDTRLVDVSSKEGDVIENLPSKRKNGYSAFVNIAFGCDKFCTYCIVPYTRGKERSRKVEDILKEVKLLKEEGYKEVTLLGQNVDSYGKDFENTDYLYNNKKVTFALLLEEVAKINIPRVRFLTSYPSDFKDDVIDVMAKYPNIMKYLHLPVQSGSNNILKKMNRRYGKEEYLDLVNRIKKKIPDIALSSDIIVGFPNESEEDFNETLDLVSKVNYASSFTFIFSPRSGTLASKMEDNVSYETKVERFKRLTKELEKSIELENKKHLDKEEVVLVNSISKTNPNYLSGTLENNKTVNFKGDKSLIGKLVKIKITKDSLYSFLGEFKEVIE